MIEVAIKELRQGEHREGAQVRLESER